jgi:formate hydrogenlyase subunit 3/multisubunit Na+/H+ antiporter MnhD subunit
MKPTTGRVQPKAPPPEVKAPKRRRQRPRAEDDDQAAADLLMTAVWTGVFLFVGVIWFAGFGGAMAILLDAVAGSWDSAWIVGLGVGLLVGVIVAVLVVRRLEHVVRGRSRTAYRGIWAGSILSLVLIGIMALPVVIPQYCPPGAICVPR